MLTCDCPCHQVVIPGLVGCPQCGAKGNLQWEDDEDMTKRRNQLPAGAINCPNCEQPVSRDDLDLWNDQWICVFCGYADPYWNQ